MDKNTQWVHKTFVADQRPKWLQLNRLTVYVLCITGKICVRITTQYENIIIQYVMQKHSLYKTRQCTFHNP